MSIYTFKTKEPATYAYIESNDSRTFPFGGIYQHRNETHIGDIVLLVLGGDQVPWKLGLHAICRIESEPETISGRYFKVGLKILLRLDPAFSKKDLVAYLGCLDMVFIGPMTKGEANQANQRTDLSKLPSLLRAIIDRNPEFEEQLTDIFGEDMIVQAKAVTNILTTNEDKVSDNYLLGDNVPRNPISDKKRNLIMYGAPGTGKSYNLNEEVKACFPDPLMRARVTFHSRYSYAHFVGSYKPNSKYKEVHEQILNGDYSIAEKKVEPLIDYSFVPGPLIEMFIKAYKNPTHNFVLIIEELNRADVASVFGEVFQLLDRDDSGVSMYPVQFNKDVIDFLKKNGYSQSTVSLPGNLYIWATMNSSDQGVYPLDSAFKRRWDFQYLTLDSGQSKVADMEVELPFVSKPIKWNSIRNSINAKLISMNIPEDRLLGPFFLGKIDRISKEDFAAKVILYLREDIVRHNPKELFKYFSLNEIWTKFLDGENVFNFEINE